MKAQTKIALRINDDNPNHHLWNNRGVWWCHVTVHKPDSTAERLRFSLKTRDIEKPAPVATRFSPPFSSISALPPRKAVGRD